MNKNLNRRVGLVAKKEQLNVLNQVLGISSIHFTERCCHSHTYTCRYKQHQGGFKKKIHSGTIRWKETRQASKPLETGL